METIIIVAAAVIVTLAATMGLPRFLSIIRGIGIGNISEDERRVISTVPVRWRKQLLRYLRTLEASRELQDHMASNIPCLRAVSKYMKREYKNVVGLNPP